MRVGVIGLNHKIADLSLRELLAKACEERFSYCHDDHTFLLLSTCNRTEIYFSSEDLAVTHSFLLHLLKQLVHGDFDQKLYSFFGYNCFLHLCRVVAGLDSAIIAETEIQGQVKIAYEKTAQAKRLPKEIHFLFQKALKVGKMIRTHFSFDRGIPDLEHAIFGLGNTHFSHPEKRNILFLGASTINSKIIHHFKGMRCERITLCNRTEEKGRKVAEQHGIAYLPWSLREEWSKYDWIVLGTKAKEYLLRPVSHLTEKKLLIDLSVPRNADPTLREEPNIILFDIDQIHQMLIKRKEQLKEKLNLAETTIALETEKQIRLYRDKESKHLLLI
jgi:glutamyl-tRNA reductase